jgi:hypothetical protein
MSSISCSIASCSKGETSVLAAFMPDAAADGSPMPGKVESPQCLVRVRG